MGTPLVSVVIPTYNGVRWLGDCLSSVLHQTYTNTEIIVVDDGSTDQTVDLLRSFEPGIHVIRQAHAGIGAARNCALRHASGDYLAFLDQDDLWTRYKLERQVQYAFRHPEMAVIYTDAEEFQDGTSRRRSFFSLFPGLRNPDHIFEEMIRFAIPLMSTTLVKATFLKEHSLSFFDWASGVDDLGLLLQIAERGGSFGYLDQCLTHRRIHQSNYSQDHLNRFSRRLALYSELLQRLPETRVVYRAALRRGLRDAQFRVGEHYWGLLEMARAREHFSEALGTDRNGIRAALYYVLSLSPARWIEVLRNCKAIWRRLQSRQLPALP